MEKNIKKTVLEFSTSSFCLVCGVDSGPVLKFFIWLVGAGLLASLCVLLWALTSNKYSNDHQLSKSPLEAEGGE